MENYVIIDVREPMEYKRGHVKGAINVPPAVLMSGPSALRNIPKDAPIMLYCVSGSRSNVSKHILESMGYTNITNGINKQQVEARLGL